MSFATAAAAAASVSSSSSASALSPSAGTPPASKESSLRGRKVVYLPEAVERSEEWSEECPFGVFFELDLLDRPEYSALVKAKRHACHGFFQTEAIANKAKEVLKQQAGLFDNVFVQKLDRSNLDFLQKGKYVIVDGFADTNWWRTKGGIVLTEANELEAERNAARQRALDRLFGVR